MLYLWNYDLNDIHSIMTGISASKSALSADTKRITAKITREEGLTQKTTRDLGILSTDAVVSIWHSTEYSFGFDLQDGQYDIQSTPDGVKVILKRPTLVAKPAVSNLRSQVMSTGIFIDDSKAIRILYEQASERAQRQGVASASDASVQALCEKRLIEFLKNFLAKQPEVKVVPQISIVYK